VSHHLTAAAPAHTCGASRHPLSPHVATNLHRRRCGSGGAAAFLCERAALALADRCITLVALSRSARGGGLCSACNTRLQRSLHRQWHTIATKQADNEVTAYVVAAACRTWRVCSLHTVCRSLLSLVVLATIAACIRAPIATYVLPVTIYTVFLLCVRPLHVLRC
jgi:urease accessory protein UreF